MNATFSMDELLFNHGKNNTQIWILGIINNASKEFRLEATKTRDSSTLKKFVKKFVATGIK